MLKTISSLTLAFIEMRDFPDTTCQNNNNMKPNFVTNANSALNVGLERIKATVTLFCYRWETCLCKALIITE